MDKAVDENSELVLNPLLHLQPMQLRCHEASDAGSCVYQRSRIVDAEQSSTAQHCQDGDRLVRHKSKTTSDTPDTNPDRR